MEQRLHERVQRVGMEQRKAGVEHVVRPDAEGLRGVDAPPVELRMRATDALGRPGRARRVEDRERVARSDRRGVERRARAGERAGLEPSPGLLSLAVEQPEALEFLRKRREGVELRHELCLEGDRADARVVEDVLELWAAGSRVDRYEDGAEPGTRDEGIQ